MGKKNWVTELKDALNDLTANVVVFAAYTQCQITNDVFVIKEEQVLEERCDYDYPWQNQKYQASEFRVEYDVDVAQGGITFMDAISLFHYGSWPTSHSLFMDGGGFGSSLCF